MIIDAIKQAIHFIEYHPARILFVVPHKKYRRYLAAGCRTIAFNKDIEQNYHWGKVESTISTKTSGMIVHSHAADIKELAKAHSGCSYDAIYAFEFDADWDDEFYTYLASFGRSSSMGMRGVRIPIQNRVAII